MTKHPVKLMKPRTKLKPGATLTSPCGMVCWDPLGRDDLRHQGPGGSLMVFVGLYGL